MTDRNHAERYRAPLQRVGRELSAAYDRNAVAHRTAALAAVRAALDEGEGK